MKLIIIRGPSGTGKSTIARHLGGIARTNWFEADQFFIHNGVYNFDLKLLGQSHKWCQNSVRKKFFDIADGRIIGPPALPHNNGTIIVSNTSTTLKELNYYLNLVKEYNVACEIIRTPGPWNVDELFARNQHGVPREVLERQIARYVPHPDEREWTDMEIFNAPPVDTNIKG